MWYCIGLPICAFLKEQSYLALYTAFLQTRLIGELKMCFYYFNYVHVSVFMCESVDMSAGAHTGQ